jgi:outer membrane usher protein
VSALTRRRSCIASVLLCALLLIPAIAAAQDQRAMLELVVNRVSAGESLVIIRGADALVPITGLTQAGLTGFKGRRETVGDQEYVSLSSLAPDLAFTIDELELRLNITATPDLLGRTIHDLWGGAPANLVYRRDTSSYLNYAVNWHTGNHADLFAESATSYKGASFYNTLSATDHSASRGLTSATIDRRTSMQRWTLGDSLAYSGALGGDAWIGGITVSKEFSINPYYVRYPTLSLSTPIAVPSVMEVEVNGQVVSQQQVAPGRLDVRNLPLTIGRNDARIVVRDAFGQTRELSSTYYLTTTALAPGVHDYQYSFGFRRTGVGERSWDYHAPVLLARHRVGLTNATTAGGRVEMQPGHLFSGGPSFNFRVPFGEIEAAASVSRRDNQWGNASVTAFNYTGRPISAGGSVMMATRQYATLTPNSINEDPKVQANLYASAALGRPLSLTLQQSQTKMYQGLTRARSSLLASIHIHRNVELTVSGARTRDEHGRGREAYAGLTVLFGRASATVSHTRDQRGSRMGVDAQQPLPVGAGYGYQLRVEDGATDVASGIARFQGQHGRYEVRQETVGTQTTTTLSAMGSIVGIGGGLYATRPVQQSFALIRVPGVEGVRAFASHQEIGKTGPGGDVLVPDLQAYYGNILNIADGDIPIEYVVADAGLTIAPPFRGGAVAHFDVQKVQRVLGRLKVSNGHEEKYQQYGELTVTAPNGRSYGSPIGNDGTFYFENLPKGAYAAVMEYRGTRCAFQLVIPGSNDMVVDVGTVRCAVEGVQ